MSEQNKETHIPEWAMDSIHSLLLCIKINDRSTYEHSLRVGEFARKLAKELGLSDYEQNLAECAGLLHDIGKMGLNRHILHKPSRLTPLELEHVKSHTVLSEIILKPLIQHPLFKQLSLIIRAHHERMDGQGYPDQKYGDDIPLLSRVLLVVDTFDAMSTNRSYRKALPRELVFAELKRGSGAQYDSHVVDTFLKAQPFWQEPKIEDSNENGTLIKAA